MMKESNYFDTEYRFSIAIIGLSGRFPGAQNTLEFWSNLRSGVESVTSFSDEELLASGVTPELLENDNYVKKGAILDGADLFDASFFGISHREAELLDPQHRVFLESAWEALENAGYNPETFPGQIGVYAGVDINTYGLRNLASNPDVIAALGGFQAIIASDKDYLSTRVSYKLNLKGPSMTVQTACSTSLVATHLACQSLLNGESDMALAGGVAIYAPQKMGYLYQEGMILSPDGHCRAFDANAQGTIGGQGVGVVVLKRLTDALEAGDHIYAIIRGSAVNNDGAAKAGYTAPSLERQTAVIVEAMTLAGVPPESITYIEGHGTGTPLGDPIEVAALTKAFRTQTDKNGFCALGSVKTNIGHLSSASGIAGLIKTSLMFKHQEIPPILNFERPNPHINFADSPFYVNDKLLPWEPEQFPRRAGVSSFGIGGTNAHVILEEAPPISSDDKTRPWQLLLLSAKTENALAAAAANLAQHLQENVALKLANVAYTLQVGRCHFNHRRAIVCRNQEDALQLLTTPKSGAVFSRAQASDNPEVIFMFSGQGAQYQQMGRALYETEPLFQQIVDHCANQLRPYLEIDLSQALYANEAILFTETRLAQPALFVLEYALAHLWMDWGVVPVAMIGHSVGEYVAACLAGVFSLEDGLRLIAARGQLMQAMPAGAMLSVALPEDAVRPLLNERLALAAVNSTNLCVISGETEAIETLQRDLTAQGHTCRPLYTSHAFHSQMMEPVVEAFTEQMKAASFNPPQIPYISNVTGTWITAEEATSPAYWGQHLRHTVRFAEGLNTLRQNSEQIFLEVGPGRSLYTFAKQQLDNASLVAHSLPHSRDKVTATETMLKAMARLWVSGVDFKWQNFYKHEQRMRVPLPSYPFERQHYWIETGAVSKSMPDIPARPDDYIVATQLQDQQLHDRGQLTTPYAAPSNEMEGAVATIWQSLLGVEQLGVHDNFFELGGHSLLAVQLISQLQARFAVDFPLQRLFDYPTVAEVAQAIEQLVQGETAVITETSSNHGADANILLAEDITAGNLAYTHVDSPNGILLTGATGFLGAFLLYELLQQTTSHIFCLVRADDDKVGRARIKQSLSSYTLWNPAFQERIHPIAGDLAKPRLGLSEDMFDHLEDEIDVIYHCGAWVNHLLPYTALKAPNVLGTQEILRLACYRKLKPVHFISTTAVFVAENAPQPGKVLEQHAPQVGKGTLNGYSESKLIAERLVEQARARGLPVCIYRVDRVAGHSKTGACQTNDFLWQMIRGSIETGWVPDLDMTVTIVPADYVSQAVVSLSQQASSLNKVFHLTHPQPSSLHEFIEGFRTFGYDLEYISYPQWVRAVSALVAKDGAEDPLYSFIPLLPIVADIEGTIQVSTLHFDQQNTQRALAQTDIKCPTIDQSLLTTYLTYFVDTGFLPTSSTKPERTNPTPKKNIREMIDAFQTSQAIYVATELNIPDLVSERPRDITELAQLTRTHLPSLNQLMQVLVRAEVFAIDDNGRFQLDLLGQALRADVPGSERNWVLIQGQLLYQAWGGLLDQVRTGQSAFNRVYHKNFYQHIAQSPKTTAVWDTLMQDTATQLFVPHIVNYDLSAVETIVDVGGGWGIVLAEALKANPHLQGILFDQPQVASKANNVFSAAGVIDRCQIIAGDFFDKIPGSGDLYMLIRVLFNWDDAHASRILQSCYRAMKPQSRLLIMETVRPSNGAANGFYNDLDLSLSVTFGGYLRTENTLHQMITQAGFEVTNYVLFPFVSLIEARHP